VSRKTRSWVGQLGPTIASAPSRNAVSVPITTPHPRAASPLGLTARNSSAGTTIPHSAATAGTITRRRSVSSPIESSRRTSSPITKKNSAISASLTQCPRSSASTWSPTPIIAIVCHSDS
jgi:hypothetical protein